MDTLALLRRFCEQKRLGAVTYDKENSCIDFGHEYAFSPTSKTALVERGAPMQLHAVVAAARYFLLEEDGKTMRALEDAVELISTGSVAYISQSSKSGVPRVGLLALKPLIEHLCGSDTALPSENASNRPAVYLLIEAPLAETIASAAAGGQTDAQARVDVDAKKDARTTAGVVGVKRYRREIESVTIEDVLCCKKGKDFSRVLVMAKEIFAREKKEKERAMQQKVKAQQEQLKKKRKMEEEQKRRDAKAARISREKDRGGGAGAREKDRQQRPIDKQQQQQQLEYDRNRKQQMTRGGGRNRFDDVDETVYYTNAVGSAAAQFNMKGRFGETGVGPEGALGVDAPVPMPSQRTAAEDEAMRERAMRRQSGKREKRQADDRKARARVPIIIVPAGYQATLTRLNARQFLQDGKYVPVRECMEKEEEEASPASSSYLEIERRIGRNEPVLYHVRDRAPDKGSSDWARVVAVFVHGAKWQFKGWPFKGCESGDMVDAFQRVRAFHMHFSSDAVKPEVSKWNVKMLSLDRNNRYKDIGKAQEFWNELDSFLSSKRTKLAY